MSGSGGDLLRHFVDACKSGAGTIYRPSARESEQFMNLRGGPLDDAQIKWAIKLYMKQTAYPSVIDFMSWLDSVKDHLPDRLVAGAYLTDKPLLIKMGDDLETLRAAYFPSEEVSSQIESLEARLGTALA